MASKMSLTPLLFQCCVSLCFALCTQVQVAEALKEFSLARYGVTFANNSVININLVGEGYPGVPQITDSGALECHTDDTTCCRGIDNPNGGGRGEWYYPNGTVVPPPGGGSGFYRARDHMVIRLNRGRALIPTGIYTCVIPGAGGVIITRYITLVDSGQCNDLPDIINGEVTYTPSRFVTYLPNGRRYTGTIATYSCSSGYQLIGSSLRACGADGTWNGTALSCSTQTDRHATTLSTEHTSYVTPVMFTTLTEHTTPRIRLLFTTLIKPTITIITTESSSFDVLLSTVTTTSVPLEFALISTTLASFEPTTTMSLTEHTTPRPSLLFTTMIKPTTTMITTENSFLNVPLSTVTATTVPIEFVLISPTMASTPTAPPTTVYTLNFEETTTVSAVDCGPLTAPTNGQVNTASGTTVGSIGVYSCNHGYTLIGSATRTCSPDGMWTSTVPRCTALTITTTITTPTESQTFGQSYSLTCTVTGVPSSINADISYQWLRADPASNGGTTRVGVDSYMLLLNSLSLSDVGLYMCVVKVSSNLLSEDLESSSETFELKFPALFFQLRLTNIHSCTEYSVSNSRQKIIDIENNIVQNVATGCRCGFNSTHLSDSQLRCFDSSPQVVTFRSQLFETSQSSTTELVSYIEQWINERKGLVVNGVFLGFEMSCSLVINSLDDVECPGLTQDNSVGGIVGGVIAAILFLIVVVVPVIVLVVFKQRAKLRGQQARVKDVGHELHDISNSNTVRNSVDDPSQAYEAVDIHAVPVEYEEIKFKETHGNPVMMEQPHPPKGDYEYTQCQAYEPTQVTLPTQN